ncbi:sulfotransferase domain-containing protein [Lyngbya aestuarii]|uniref:sulfotransferase domain-containing protein n=1 Tax=Lyngbya aestuarii TaxID=118322 RepID=UPI00403DEF14
MRLPDFLIIGSSKAGTTTIYHYLCKHPQVYMSDPKEPEYFASEKDENYAKGIDWYASHFSKAEPHQVCGEASGRYTHWPKFSAASERIAAALPQVKLIYIMRNPVDRAYSHYAQDIKYAQNLLGKFEVTETFEENIKQDSYYLDCSNYMQQIEQYLRFFPKESFLFLLMEDLIQQPADILHKMCNFLGIDSGVDLVGEKEIKANEGRHHNEWFLRSRITDPLKKIPGVAQVAALLPQEARDQAYHLLTNLPYKQSMEEKYIPQPMLPETRQMLLEKFREPNQKLAEFLNRDLSHWDTQLKSAITSGTARS